MQLNNEQKAAVEYVEGPQVIVAGPGSGKTRVIISKIEHLVSNLGIDPARILAITFSNKAAEEMVERLGEAFPCRSHEFGVHTFHALCWLLVQEFAAEAGFRPGVKVLDQAAAWVLVRRHIEDFGLSHYLPNSDPFKFIFDLLSHVSRAKDEYVTPEEYQKYAEDLRRRYENEIADLSPEEAAARLIEVEKREELARFYTRYQETLLAENSIDFGDQIAMALKLLITHPDVRRQVQSRWDYILVDEFQDTNIAQIEILKLLSKSDSPVCVVGDPDQSIYRFRGASFASFLRFDEAYPTREPFALTRNYRSTGNILSTAAALISNNIDRYQAEKPVWTENEDGPPVTVIKAPSFSAEAEAVADEIVSILSETPPDDRRFSDFAILYRAHGHRDEFAAALERRGIPYKIQGGTGFYNKEEIKDILAVIRCAAGRMDAVSLYRVLSLADWGIPGGDLEILSRWMNDEKIAPADLHSRLNDCTVITGEIRERTSLAAGFILDLQAKARELPASEVCRSVFEGTQILKRYIYDDTLDSRQRAANLAKFLRKVRNFEEASDDKSIAAFAEYQEYLAEAGADEEEAEIDDTRDAVQMMTVHAAKGLEWPYVFVVCLCSRRFPTGNKSDAIPFPEELVRESTPQGDFHTQEERRLAYVALTRAQKRLFLSYVERKGIKPSVFINEVAGAPGTTEKAAPEVTFDSDIEPADKIALVERDIRRYIMRLLDQSASVEPLRPYVELLDAVRRIDDDPGAVRDKLVPGIDPAVYQAVDAAVRERIVLFSVSVSTPPEPLYLSYSRMSRYKECPMGYRFAYDLKIPGRIRHYFAFGNTVHDSLQKFLEDVRAGKEPTLEDLKATYHQNWRGDGYIIKAQEEGYKRDGEAALEAFFKRYQMAKVVPLHLEWSFTLPVGGHFITGRVDRIDPLGEGTCSVLDYKTGKPKTQKDVDSDLQLTIYALAVRECLGLEAKDLSLYFLQTDEIFTATRTEEQLAAVEEEVLSVAENILARRFEPAPDAFKCGRCDYAGICWARDV